jgi:hypothetical protein
MCNVLHIDISLLSSKMQIIGVGHKRVEERIEKRMKQSLGKSVKSYL